MYPFSTYQFYPRDQIVNGNKIEVFQLINKYRMIEIGHCFITPNELMDLGHDYSWPLTPQRDNLPKY